MKRSEELAAEWRLAPGAAGMLERLADRISGDQHAPTSVRDPAQVAEVHLADSLLALSVPALRAAGRIVDIGSGAGLPGLPIAAALPDTRVDLVESAGRKSEWIAGAVRTMGLPNARSVHARIEEWAADEGREAYDVALARAVDVLPVLVEYAAPLLRPAGVLVAWKRNLGTSETERGDRAAQQLGLELERVPGVSGERAAPGQTELVVYRRTGPLPAGYPRRPGRARKRPLA